MLNNIHPYTMCPAANRVPLIPCRNLREAVIETPDLCITCYVEEEKAKEELRAERERKGTTLLYRIEEEERAREKGGKK
jgi:hypothetical protein